MELRKTEETIQDLVSRYESIRQSTLWTPNQARLLLLLPSESFTFITPPPAIPPPPPPPPPIKAEADTITDSVTDNAESSGDGGDHCCPSTGTTNVIIDDTSPAIATTTTTTNIAAPAPNSNPISSEPIVSTIPPLLPDTSKWPPITDLETLVTTVQFIEQTLRDDGELVQTMNRFRFKLEQVDPVTNRPRYGPNSYARVRRMLAYFDFLSQQNHHHPNNNMNRKTTDDLHPSMPTTTTSYYKTLTQDMVQLFQQQQALRQQQTAREEQIRWEEQHRQQQQKQEEEARERALAEIQAKQRVAEQAAEAERLRRQAEAARQRRQEQEEARRQAEQRYLDSIKKGVDGVQHYVNVIKESTSNDLAAQKKAFQSLFTLFDQILKHPEETNFRKIRKNHPVFHQDIGRHKGGIELLIAAGFRPKLLPDVSTHTQNDIDHDNDDDNNGSTTATTTPSTDSSMDAVPMIACLISKEPNLETDMDGWSQWYDLKKATLEILQKEVGNNNNQR
ncbi:PUB domain containing protein [Nitzschia inconspicua]|uniref:PUB domain containing protein n=1 Tax=Nitzschia inconspicua TaxID=303405 RepID=A0A9K3LMQ9_9STRA|nr:PUB domain containing protein [Nitzschia inconspicua]